MNKNLRVSVPLTTVSSVGNKLQHYFEFKSMIHCQRALQAGPMTESY